MSKRLAALLAVIALGVVAWLLAGDDASQPAGPADETPAGPGEGGPQLEAAGVRPAPAAPAQAPPTREPPPAREPTVAVELTQVRVRLGGRVLDPEGRPLPDVPVRVHPYYEGGGADAPLLAEGVTDGEGRFALDFRPRLRVTNHDPWIRLRVAAFHPTWVMTVANAYVDSRALDEEGFARDDLVLRMQPAFEIACRVRDEDGRPIAGATCALEQFYGRKRWVDGRPVEARTDADGRARLRLPRLPDEVILLRLHGHNALRVSAPGFATVYHRVHVPDAAAPGFVLDADVVLPAPLDIRGTLMDDTGTRLPDTVLSVTGTREGEWAAIAETGWSDHALRTDADGAFVVPAVAPGSWQLEFEAAGHRPARLHADAGARDLAVRLTRFAPTVLLFRDTRSGAWLGAQGYELTHEGGGGQGTSGGAPEFRVALEDLQPGKYELVVRFAGRAQPFTGSFTAVPGATEPLVLDVPPPAAGEALSGVVVGPDGEPLRDAWLTLAPVLAGEEEAEDLTWRTSADGTFRFEGVSAGSYVLEAEANALATQRARVRVTAGATPAPLRIALVAGATLRVALPAVPEDAGWRYEVQVLHEAGYEMGLRHRREGSALVFRHVEPGDLVVTLETSQFLTRRFEGDPFSRTVAARDGEEALLSFEDVRPVVVRGRVLGKDGQPMASRLQLRRISPSFDLADVAQHWFHGNKKAATDDQGRFSFGGLLPGRYAAAQLTAGGQPLTFEVRDGGIEDLVLRCDR